VSFELITRTEKRALSTRVWKDRCG